MEISFPFALRSQEMLLELEFEHKKKTISSASSVEMEILLFKSLKAQRAY